MTMDDLVLGARSSPPTLKDYAAFNTAYRTYFLQGPDAGQGLHRRGRPCWAGRNFEVMGIAVKAAKVNTSLKFLYFPRHPRACPGGP